MEVRGTNNKQGILNHVIHDMFYGEIQWTQVNLYGFFEAPSLQVYILHIDL